MTGNTRGLPALKFQGRLLRRAYRRAWQTARYGSLGESPVLFANSFPKSGTHLLTQVMHGLTRIGPAVDSGLPAVVTFDGFTGRRRTTEEILGDLRRYLPGDIGYGHVHAFPTGVDLLCSPGFAAYFILRDPRDVVVSHVHYVAEMAPSHIHHRYYHEVLHSFDERLQASIAGVSVDELSRANDGRPALEPLPDIRQRFEPFLAWLDHPETLTLRYEDFLADRCATLERVLDHVIDRGFRPQVNRASALKILSDSIDPSRSPTFRSGKAGGWRAAFNPEQRRLFDDVFGDIIQNLGYDPD